MSLSDKIGQGCEPYRLSISDVKQFIKDIKNITFHVEFDASFRDEHDKRIMDAIDKLAGKDLI